MIDIDHDDGVKVINIFSKGRTKLGQLLSNFAYTPFSVTEGSFNSIEAYWYFLLLNDCPEKENIKLMHGANAKKYGEELINKYGINNKFSEKNNNFKAKISKAIIAKVENNEEIQKLIIESDLPFDHYYFYKKKQSLPQYKWLVAIFEDIRSQLKQ